MTVLRHGRKSAYNKGCRCDDCTEANTLAARARRLVVRLDANDFRHGTLNGYCNYSCRCAACTAVHNERMRQYMPGYRQRQRAAS